MIHAFILIVLIAGTQEPNPMYFRSIDVCQYYAKRVVNQYGNYRYRSMVPAEHRITAYCKSVKVDPKTTLVYDY